MTKASTLSVLLTGSPSILIWAQFGTETCNLSVRFDGDDVRICGYPQHFSLHDDEDYNPDAETVVTRVDETIILEAVIRGIKRQARDKMFKDACTAEYRRECMDKCTATIKRLMIED